MLKKWLYIALLLITQASFAAPIPIIFWHSMGGGLQTTLNGIIDQFNQSQTEYQVIGIYKGTYPETLTATAAAFRAHQQPDLVQIFEVGTATMISPSGIIIPVSQPLASNKTSFHATDLLPALRSYYSDTQGKLLAMPFNSSAAVMYYNKQAFQAAGLQPNQPPKTWPKLKSVALKIIKAGYECGFTTGWPSWIQVESFSAWHDLPLATQQNGFAGQNAKLVFNNPTLVNHIATLAAWQQQHIFQYGGREDDAQALFTSGKCAILMESSGSRAELVSSVNFPVGIAALPYWPQLPHAPQNALIGGGAIWVLTGHAATKNKGIAEFLAFLASPKIQVAWQAQTGYVPITQTAYRLSQQQGYYLANPGADVAIKELIARTPTINSMGIRLGYYPQIREVIEQALEAVFSGQATAQQALDNAVRSGNELLQNFAENVHP